MEHVVSQLRSEAMRAVNHAFNEAQMKAKENKKKGQFDRQVRQDRGEDILDTDEEEEEEGEVKGDDGGIAWDALIVEDEPVGGDSP
jgi:hypothetical protein